MTALETPCREFNGTRTGGGYGMVRRDGGKHLYVHRMIMERMLGRPLRPGEVVMHRCDNPPCFRFDHLRLGTQKANLADMRAKNRGSRPPTFRGSEHHAAKLTETDVLEIRRLQGLVSYAEVMRRFGISSTSVYYIWNRRTWTHIPPEAK